MVGFSSEKATRDRVVMEVLNIHAIAAVPSSSDADDLRGLLLRPRGFRCGVPSVAGMAMSLCGKLHLSPYLQDPSRFQKVHVGLCLSLHLSPYLHSPFM